jgi:WD40 repeat protein
MMKKPTVIFLFLSLLLSGCNSLVNSTPAISSSVPPAPAATPSNPAPSPQPTPVAITGFASPVTHLAWSPDGTYLASASGGFDATDDTIYLWHTDGTPAGKLIGHTQPVTGLA